MEAELTAWLFLPPKRVTKNSRLPKPLGAIVLAPQSDVLQLQKLALRIIRGLEWLQICRA